MAVIKVKLTQILFSFPVDALFVIFLLVICLSNVESNTFLGSCQCLDLNLPDGDPSVVDDIPVGVLSFNVDAFPVGVVVVIVDESFKDGSCKERELSTRWV